MQRLYWTIVLLLKITLLFAAAIWFYFNPGTLQIDWQGTTIRTSTSFAAAVIAIALLVFAVIYHWWCVVLSLPKQWRNRRRQQSLELGCKALNKGLLAVAAADAYNAEKQAKKALSLLPDVALTHLLAAQAAQLRQDTASADTHLAILSQHPDGQLFGLRGQLMRALQREDRSEALRLARLAYAQQPQQPWVIDTTIQIEARQKNWVQAEKILRQALRLGGKETAKWEKDLAAVLLALSDKSLLQNDVDDALACARDALKFAPHWAPAVTRVAELWQHKTYRRRAQKALITAWENIPHPDLVTAWLHVSGGERAVDRTALIEKLINHNPENAEAAMAVAQAYLSAGLWGVARQHAARAIQYRPDRAAYRLMADIEQADTASTEKTRAWLEKAADVPIELQWYCMATGTIYPQWQVLNERHDFNTIAWQSPVAIRDGSDDTLLLTQ